jgi:hypothetical protein
MYSVTIHKNLGLMMILFAAALLMAFSVNANGQWRDRDDDYYRNSGRVYRQDNRNGRWGGVSQKELRKAYERGYKQGQKDGRRASRDGYYGNGGYRNGGYGNSGYGTYGGNGRYNGGYYGGGQIQRAYQDGYQRGYREGFDRNRRYDRNDPYYRNNNRYGNRTIFGIPLPY